MTAVCMLVQNPYDGDVRVRRKAEALVEAGYSVDVLALPSPRSPRAYRLNGVNVYTIPLTKKRGSVLRYVFEYVVFFLWALLRLTALTASRRYTIVEVNTLPDFLVFAAAPARWLGARIVLDMHEIMPEFYMSKYGLGERSPMVRLLMALEKLSVSFADHVIVIHEPIQELLVGRGLARAKSSVVMNAVDEAHFSARRHPTTPGEATGDSARFIMMYHGTLTSIYGLDMAIEALAMTHAEIPRAELWILGDGPERARLQDLARARGLTSQVRVLGSVPTDEVAGWVARCDIGVLPMRRDVFLDFAFPNKLSEYIVSGKSVLVPRLKALRHYFSDDALAYFEPNDIGDLARQMRRLYGDPAVRGRLADRARAEYRALEWPVMKQRYLGLIADMMSDTLGAGAPAGARNARMVR